MKPVTVYVRIVWRLSLFGILSPFGCAGTETGNPSMTRQASLSMVLKSSDPSVAQVCPAGVACTSSSLNVQSAWLSTDYLEAASCVGQDDSIVPPAAWDLLYPVAKSFDTQIPQFCGFRFVTRVGDASLGNIPAELVGASIWLRVTRVDNVVVDIRSPTILDVGNVDPSHPLGNARLVVALDVAAWFEGIDLNALNVDSDGIARVSSTSNPLILQVLEQQTGNNAILRDEEADDGVAGD